MTGLWKEKEYLKYMRDDDEIREEKQDVHSVRKVILPSDKKVFNIHKFCSANKSDGALFPRTSDESI